MPGRGAPGRHAGRPCAGGPGGGSRRLWYGSPVSMARCMASYISRMTRLVRYSPRCASSLRLTMGKVSIGLTDSFWHSGKCNYAHSLDCTGQFQTDENTGSSLASGGTSSFPSTPLLESACPNIVCTADHTCRNYGNTQLFPCKPMLINIHHTHLAQGVITKGSYCSGLSKYGCSFFDSPFLTAKQEPASARARSEEKFYAARAPWYDRAFLPGVDVPSCRPTFVYVPTFHSPPA